MDLPLAPPLDPMLAKAAADLPEGDEWLYEPKWDGFRALVFRDGDELLIQSRDRKPLERYFPELAAPLLANLPPRCVLDGEVVIARDGALDFDALLLRIHPAASRVTMLAEQTPASYVAWDLLAYEDELLLEVPQAERRSRLEATLAEARPPIHLTPLTRDRETAADWFARFEGAGLDGVIAKDAAAAYEPGKRRMIKVKHRRTADCVVAGFRWHKNGAGTHVGSLILGLFDDAGVLHHVGVTSSFKWDRRAELAAELAPLRDDALDGHPWARVGRLVGRGGGVRTADARCDVALEPGQGPLVGAAAGGARGRGRLRPSAGRPFPSCHHVRALAAGQGGGATAATTSSRRPPRTNCATSLRNGDVRRIRTQ